MNFFTITRLQQITVVSLIILIVSWPVITHLKQSNQTKEQTLEESRGELAVSQANETFVKQALGADAAHNENAQPIDDAYTKAIVEIRQSAPPHLVNITSLTVGIRQLDAKGVAVREVAEPTSTGRLLRKVRVRAKGRYESLTAFLNYLDRLKASPAIVRSVEINKDQFDIEVLVLGV